MTGLMSIITFVEVPVDLSFCHVRIKWHGCLFKMTNHVFNETSTVEAVALRVHGNRVYEIANRRDGFRVPNDVMCIEG